VAVKGDAAPEEEALVARLDQAGAIGKGLNLQFLTGSDATDPTAVGVWGAFKGSLLTMLVTLALAFPIGVLSAVYLEEYAPRNRWTDLIEVSINNLAAVPSIIFGLLGLAVFLNFMHLPRSAPLVGGITLGPDDDADHRDRGPQRDQGGAAVDPRRRPRHRREPHPGGRAPCVAAGAAGILTGTIIGMARGIGETAPCMMIGMRAFISSPPGGLPIRPRCCVQIFLWSTRSAAASSRRRPRPSSCCWSSCSR
jgi:phosphate transport system permease protein